MNTMLGSQALGFLRPSEFPYLVSLHVTASDKAHGFMGRF